MLALNSFLIRPLPGADTSIVVDSELYTIESSNTIEVTNQSVATPAGNEHTIIKTANDSTIGTKIPGGSIAVFTSNADSEDQVPNPSIQAVLLPANL